jgi:hypothetical protein
MPGYAPGVTLGEEFARAFAAKDTDTLRQLLAPTVDFRGMTPGRFWEAQTPDQVLDILLANWVDQNDEVTALLSVEPGDAVVDTNRVGYRLAVMTPDGPHTVEQQMYYREEDGRLVFMRVVCSGFRPTS